MLGMVLILVFAFWIAFLPLERPQKAPEEHSAKFENQMKQLWGIAQTSMKESRSNRAERALLAILKFDEKNAAAYNRLGILYAKNQKYNEAIECFEIAQSLDNGNPSCLHNVGLIYLETGAYEKAAMAFQQAIELEGDVPARHIALAKALEKIGKRKEAIESLENAYELDRSTSTLRQILALHEEAGDQEAIAATTARIEEQIAGEAKFKAEKKAQKSRATKTTARAERRAVKSASRTTRTARATKTTTTRTTKTSKPVVSAPVSSVTRRVVSTPRRVTRSAVSHTKPTGSRTRSNSRKLQ